MVTTKPKDRKVASMRISSKIYAEFKQNCIMTGQSICHILETLMIAYNESLSTTHKPSPLTPIHIDLHVTREVRRARRATLEDFTVPDGLTFSEYADMLNNPWRYHKSWKIKMNPTLQQARR